MKTDPEEIATWLARETGHAPGTEEGYEDEETVEETPRRFGLPQDKHEKMRRFFDGLHVEKAMTEKRQAEAMSAVDEAEQMNEALKGAIPPGGGY